MRLWYRDLISADDPSLRAEIAQVLSQERGLRKTQTHNHSGRVVEFRRGGSHACGVLRPLPNRPHAWRVLDQEGRTRSIRGDKIVDVAKERLHAPQQDKIVHALRAIDRHRDELKRNLDLKVLWEVVAEEPGRIWSLDELSALFFSREPNSDQRAALSRVLDDGAWFTRSGQGFVRRSATGVAAWQERLACRERDQALLQAWSAWARAVADGRDRDPPEGVETAIALLEQAALSAADTQTALSPAAAGTAASASTGTPARSGPHVVADKRVAALMHGAHLHGPGAAFDVLVRLGHWSADENLTLRRYALPVDFTAEWSQDPPSLSWHSAARRARRWRWGATWGLGMGPEGVDRAISIRRTPGGLRVALHFASPALLDDPGGLLERTARERAQSIHLPEGTIPMLPADVASHCRLVDAQWRPALTVAFTLTRTHAVRRAHVMLRRVRLGERIDWDTPLDQLPAGAPWRGLHETAVALRARRQDRGAIILDGARPEPRVRDGVVELVLRDPQAPVRQLVEELTIQAHCIAAALCAAKAIPAVYRVTPSVGAPSEIVPEPATDTLRLRDYLQGKRLTRASTQVDPGPHHVVGAAQYVTLSQPLHRYTDFLLHRQLLCWLTGVAEPSPRAHVEAVLAQTSWSRSAIREVENSAHRYWLLRYLEQRGAGAMAATVLEVRGHGYWVELDECGLRARVDAGGEIHAQPGARLRVEVSQVSARRDLLRLRLRTA